jgi:YidC/Oxa1 family membrane protein insertase
MNKRFILFLILSATIFLGWQLVIEKFFPQLAPPKQPAVSAPTPAPAATIALPAQENTAPAPAAPATQADLRQIRIKSDYWQGTLSNQGGVLSEWTVTRFTDGKEIDRATGGVNLISGRTSQEIGAPFRLFIPEDRALERELNEARYEIEPPAESEIQLARDQSRPIVFLYRRDDLMARKTFVFNGAGYDFDLQIEVTRGGRPVSVAAVIGPNFGDQKITSYSTYVPPPQVSYAEGDSISRMASSSVEGEGPHAVPAAPIRWASIDDNYFALALVPAQPASVINLFSPLRKEKVGEKETERHYLSVAVPVPGGQINRVYAGPKDLQTLAAVSRKFGLGDGSGNLEDIINYGWLSFIAPIIKPIAQFMLKSLLFINQFTRNYGWAIVILTVVLNMFFFPLRWYSSRAMKRTAAMQPKMREIQEKLRKLDKSDPRALELQREQIALMREGNPLMGCLLLLLQMPFFLAVFTILTVSIEVRHAPFFGWIHDLSAPDPYWILPLAMCASMIAQQALTPTTADPVQKRVGYLMPLIFTYFLTGAPAGLVLYWMVSNLVGVGQQFVINRLNPPATTTPSPTDKPNTTVPKWKKAKAELARS